MAPTDSAQAMATARSSWRSTWASADPGAPDDAGAGQAGVLEGNDGEPTGHVYRLHGGYGHPGGAGGHQHLGQSRSRASGDQQVVGDGGRLDRALDAVQYHLVTLEPDVEGDGPEPVGRDRLAQAPGGQRRPRQQTVDQLLGAVTGLAEGGGDHVGHGQRPGGGVAAELVGQEAQVDETVVPNGAPTVDLTDQQRRPPQLGAPAPVVAVEADRVVPQAPELADGDELVEQLRCGVREELLVGTQRQQHGSPYSPVFGGLWSLRPRRRRRRPSKLPWKRCFVHVNGSLPENEKSP